MTIEELRTALERRKGQKESLKTQLREAKQDYVQLNKDLILHDKAHAIITHVAEQTQKQLHYHISDIVNLALEGVFEQNPYKLVVDFVQRRNKTECDLLFERNNARMSPLDASGHGAADVASLALRIACWTLRSNRTRNVIILDEPLRNLDDERQELASQMIKEISTKLNIQFIIVTHEEALTQKADQISKTTKNNKEETHVQRT